MYKKIVSFLLLIVIFVGVSNIGASASCYDKGGLIEKDSDDYKIIRYVEDFLSKIYPDKRLTVTESRNIYNSYGAIGGYCYEISDRETKNGYLIIDRKGDMICISEYAIQENIKNPFEEIISFFDIDADSESIKYVSDAPDDYCVLDTFEDVGYTFSDGYKIISNFKTVSQNRLFEKDSSYSEYSGHDRSLNGYTVITDSYSGTVLSSNTITNADNIGYYGTGTVNSIGANYCCAVVAACNLIKYFRSIGFYSITLSFASLYDIIWESTEPEYDTEIHGYGAIPGYECLAAEEYLDDLGYSCSYDDFWFEGYSDFTDAVDDDNPCIMEYFAYWPNHTVHFGHAILVVGYVHTTQNKFLKVSDSWCSYLRYINYDGYDYDDIDGYEFYLSS